MADMNLNPKHPLKVFLCHAHADRDPVRGLYTRLTQDGVDAWLDKAKLLPGQDWELEIRKAVREADVVVVCLSKQFNQAGFRQKEVRLALDTAMEKPEGEIFIIPARLEECDNLESLRKWHWVDLFDDDGYEMLMRALQARANKIGATLQVKKNWLPNITSPRAVQHKPTVINQTVAQEATPVPRIEVKKPKRKLNLKQLLVRTGMVILGAASILTLVLTFLRPPIQKAESTPTSKITSTNNTQTFSSPSPVMEVSETSSQPTLIITVTPTSLPNEIMDAKDVSMVLVPAGEFLAGDEKHLSTVNLDSFYIDKYEVTNSLYKECVKARKCDSSTDTKVGGTNYFNDKAYLAYPVVFVTQSMAKIFCEWRDARLPNGMEWEKAARGADGRIYPWGSETDFYLRANGPGSKDGFSLPAPVGSFTLGVSPYGVYDMAGNVSELIDDYSQSSWDLVEYPIYRGGSWLYYYDTDISPEDFLKVTSWGLAYKWYNSRSDLGFRCARSAP